MRMPFNASMYKLQEIAHNARAGSHAIVALFTFSELVTPGNHHPAPATGQLMLRCTPVPEKTLTCMTNP